MCQRPEWELGVLGRLLLRSSRVLDAAVCCGASGVFAADADRDTSSVERVQAGRSLYLFRGGCLAGSQGRIRIQRTLSSAGKWHTIRQRLVERDKKRLINGGRHPIVRFLPTPKRIGQLVQPARDPRERLRRRCRGAILVRRDLVQALEVRHDRTVTNGWGTSSRSFHRSHARCRCRHRR